MIASTMGFAVMRLSDRMFQIKSHPRLSDATVKARIERSVEQIYTAYTAQRHRL
jgi:hypothetical protein